MELSHKMSAIATVSGRMRPGIYHPLARRAIRVHPEIL